MKKEYIAPTMYAETFVPNEYATTCKPGVDETKAEPYYEQCYYYTHRLPGASCSNYNTTLAFLTEKTSGCNLKLTSTGDVSTTGTGVEIVQWDFLCATARDKQDGHLQSAYKWPNGMGGSHYIPVTELGGVDTETGLPIYFNS